jgi:SAM-dependent methyltransferase
MKKNIPWWLRISAKILLSRIPIGYDFWQRIGLFRHGHMDQASYVINVFNSHISMSGLDGDLQGKTLLELGPGDSIFTAIVAACYGCNTILIDAGSFATRNINSYKKFSENLEKRGLSPPNISDAETLDDILISCKARYLTDGLSSFKYIETGSVDLILSQAVLEHVRKNDFLETMKECARVLVDSGVASHRVDLKDHLGGRLNNLRFNERLWESDFFVKSGFYTNRIRFSDMMKLFSVAGFSIDASDISRWEELPIKRHSLAQEFLHTTDDDLLVSGFTVRLSKQRE